MIEDGHPHGILARLGTLVLHPHAVQDLGPEAVIIPHPQNRGMTQDLFHHKRESTVEKGRTLGTVERGHICDLHPIMAQGAGVKLQLGGRAEAEVLILKSTLGNQMETGLLVSDQLEVLKQSTLMLACYWICFALSVKV
ncbi:hypothetical protein FH972_009588 [Carpinus fangiana]|uniref:Uncharacterized protein n=1 Tax=Carpinus fangiana TaxID=176857 RepID=A0A660KKS3_9ROSI|nr:hypothetical protein FH972_009588 [Carpinus fangiana]